MESTDEKDVFNARRGDWVRRMRFWRQSTREVEASAHQRLSARAFAPKARSPDPITTPQGCLEVYGDKDKAQMTINFHSW